MKRLSAFFALACAAIAVPALAATYVQDGASMLSASTVSSLDQRIGNFNAQTGKEIVVVTVPSLNGTSLADAAHQAYTQRNVNGVLIFIAKDDRRDIIVPDAAGVSAGWFTRDTLDSIRETMESQFKAEDYDGGVTSAVNGVLNVYRAHVATNSRRENYNPVAVPGSSAPARNGGFHISMFWWIVIIVVGFLILRSIIRAASAQRYGAGMPPGGIPPGGMPPAGYGYGPGYGGGFGGGGGNFWSGLLGGLGGAWLGNEMFGNRGGGNVLGGSDVGAGGGAAAGGDAGSWGGGGADSGGWANDAGQADMGGASSGDWSGGGFGGDSGGGGFDGGGGGGDSGGGW
ncbi:MAG TPA: TPM domain-containing protein [Candidatus Tumulicola sp.]